MFEILKVTGKLMEKAEVIQKLLWEEVTFYIFPCGIITFEMYILLN